MQLEKQDVVPKAHDPLTHPSRELVYMWFACSELRRTACEDPENGEPLKVKNRGGLTRELWRAWQPSPSAAPKSTSHCRICIDPSHAPASPQFSIARPVVSGGLRGIERRTTPGGSHVEHGDCFHSGRIDGQDWSATLLSNHSHAMPVR